MQGHLREQLLDDEGLQTPFVRLSQSLMGDHKQRCLTIQKMLML